MAAIEITGLNKFYGDMQALFDVSLDIQDGEFVVFVGPSGCGKSTLLRTLAGLEGIDSGTVAIAGKDVTKAEPADRDISMVFQSYALYPHMSVRENMDFGMKVNGFEPGLRQERIAEAARILQLEDYLDRKPGQLSGGQRQRVAIGRAIVKNPSVFLFESGRLDRDPSCPEQTPENSQAISPPFCLFNFAAFNSLHHPTERLGLSGTLDHEFSGGTTGFLELLASHRDTTGWLAPAPIFPPVFVPGDHPQNPFGEELLLFYRALDTPARRLDTTSEALRIVAGNFNNILT